MEERVNAEGGGSGLSSRSSMLGSCNVVTSRINAARQLKLPAHIESLEIRSKVSKARTTYSYDLADHFAKFVCSSREYGSLKPANNEASIRKV